MDLCTSDCECCFLIQAIYTADDGLIDGPRSGGTLFPVVASCMELLLQSLLSLFSWLVMEMSMDLISCYPNLCFHKHFCFAWNSSSCAFYE